MKKHVVTFCSPGTFVSEMTSKPIKTWDVSLAVQMVDTIKERYGATPYGFYFTTRSRGPTDLDSKEIKRSAMYYLGGKVLTLKQIKKRNDASDKILISNMECNNWDRVIVNTNSWKCTLPLNKEDIVLDYKPPKAIKKNSKTKGITTMQKTKEIDEELDTFDLHSFQGPIKDIIKRLRGYSRKYNRHTNLNIVVQDFSYENVSCSLVGKRAETDLEKSARIQRSESAKKAAKKRVARQKEEKDKRERKQYEKLRAKFECI